MGTVTRRIGLSLGADICWPICYEDILRELDLEPTDVYSSRAPLDARSLFELVTIDRPALRWPSWQGATEPSLLVGTEKRYSTSSYSV